MEARASPADDPVEMTLCDKDQHVLDCFLKPICHIEQYFDDPEN